MAKGEAESEAELVEQLAQGYMDVAGHPPAVAPSMIVECNFIRVRKNVTLEHTNIRAACCAKRREIYIPWWHNGQHIEFDYAHELIELGLLDLEERSPGRFPADRHEQLVDRGARALTLPRSVFPDSVRELGVNIPALGRRYLHGRLYDAAVRLTDLFAGFVVAEWDGPRRTDLAWSADVVDPQSMAPYEAELMRLAYRNGQSQARTDHPHLIGRVWRTSSVRPNSAITVCQLRRTTRRDGRGSLVLEYDRAG